MLTLHYAKGTIATASLIALEEVGAPYQTVAIDFKSAEQTKPAYLALNPKGRVPLLQTPDGPLTETGAILDYVAPSLIPDAPYARAKMQETMYYLASTMHVAHAHKMRGSRWADRDESHADMTAKVPETVTACCAYLEDTLPLSPFAQGDAITLADPYLFTLLSWAPGDGVDLTAFAKLTAFQDMMNARASVQALRDKGLF